MKVSTSVLSCLLLLTLVMLVDLQEGKANATSYAITKVKSGLLASDSLTSGNMTDLSTGGTASLYGLYEDGQGLHIGVQSPQSGTWVNHYANLPRPDARLYHITLTIPENSISDGVFNPALHVEGSDYIPHVSCEAYADNTGYYWAVGDSSDAGQTYTMLWISKPSSMPHTQDCTLITNGANYLKVYIGGNLVYSSTSLSLGMSTPFVTFVQDDTSSSSSMHYATYGDYYATTGESITINNIPSGIATVKLVDQTGTVLASSNPSSGTATIEVAQFRFPLSAQINLYDSNNAVVASSPESIYGGDAFSVTSSVTPTAPNPPTGLEAIPFSSSQINLAWVEPSNDGGSTITGYKIERSTDGGSTWSTLVANTASTATSYSDTGLAASTTYTYRVSAINSVGTSSQSNMASATTQNISSSGGSPAAVVVNSVESVSADDSSSPYQITLPNVSAGTGNDRLLVVGISADSSFASSVSFGGTALAQRVSTFANNDAEFWYLTKPNGTGNVVVTMAGPTSAVVGVYVLSGVNQTEPIPSMATNQGAGNPTVSLVTKYPESMVIDIPSIYGGSTLSEPTCLQHWDLNIPHAITGASSTSVQPSASTTTCSWTNDISTNTWDDAMIEVKGDMPQIPPVLSPSAPENLVAIPGDAGIRLSWSSPSNNGGSAITGYNIYRGTYSGGESSTPIATGITNTTYTNTGLTNGQSYYYVVTAVNSAGASPSSNEAVAVPEPLAISPSAPRNLVATGGNLEVSLSWQAPSSDGGAKITGYEIYRGTSASGESPTPIASGITATSYVDPSVTNGKTYYYTIAAVNYAGISARSNEASAIPATVPQPPGALSATTVSISQINLSWTPPSNNGGLPIEGYRVERSSNGGATWTIVDPMTGTTPRYLDSNLDPSTTYYYRVSAINSVGSSSPSSPVSIATPYAIKILRTGLVARDPLTNETESQQYLQLDQKYWTYYGDAISENATYDFFRDTAGLHVGVQSPSSGKWAGFYAESPNTSAELFHSTITTPVKIIPENFYENGLYVQTSQPFINYVDCFSFTNNQTTDWAVGSVTGNSTKGTIFKIYYIDSSPNQPLTRDCTIITNGTNYLKVYLDGINVYTSNTLDLQMPGPFNSYLEPESSYAGQLLNGTYADYYATTDEYLHLTGLPSNAARLDLESPSGKVITTGTVQNGSAEMEIGQFQFPIAANLLAYDSSNRLVSATPRPVDIYGGDVYSVG